MYQGIYKKIYSKKSYRNLAIEKTSYNPEMFLFFSFSKVLKSTQKYLAITVIFLNQAWSTNARHDLVVLWYAAITQL